MYQDRWYQTESVDSIAPYYVDRSEKKNPLIGLPTGTGKSLVIARLIQRIFENFPHHRGLALTHDKRLIEQNAGKLNEIWPNAPLGICSAGLNRKEINQPIIFGGIQTVIADPTAFGRRDFIFVDEAHMISNKSGAMYNRFINQQKLMNPDLMVCGLSATLYRMKMGELTDNDLFTDVAYDLTGIDGFNRLLSEGYIAPLVPQPTGTKLDVDGVKISGGEFQEKALQEAVDKQEITYRCCEEMVARAWDRNSWLVFATGIEHAEHIAVTLNSMGVTAAAVHSKQDGKLNDTLIAEFKAGRIKCLVNNGMLTTGFDWPPVDFIGMMRPTMSPGLWVQMLGRGTRPYDGRFRNQYKIGFEYIKIDCLVLDFAQNCPRLGPINDPKKPRKPGQKGGDLPIKICPKCNTYNHASARWCSFCKFEFPFEGAKLFVQASEEALIRGAEHPVVEWFNVNRTEYYIVQKANSPDMMKVAYYSGMRQFTEVVCLEHPGYASKRARDWWRQRSGNEPPETTVEALRHASTVLQQPKRIRVWLNKANYPEVLTHEF